MFKLKKEKKPEANMAFKWSLNVGKSLRIGLPSGLAPGDVILNKDDGKMYYITKVERYGDESQEEVTGAAFGSHYSKMLKPGTPFKKITAQTKI